MFQTHLFLGMQADTCKSHINWGSPACFVELFYTQEQQESVDVS